jgi:hypothetical protein
MRAKYNVVKIMKDAMTGEACTPSLLLVKSLDGVFGQILYTGSKVGAHRLIKELRAQ